MSTLDFFLLGLIWALAIASYFRLTQERLLHRSSTDELEKHSKNQSLKTVSKRRRPSVQISVCTVPSVPRADWLTEDDEETKRTHREFHLAGKGFAAARQAILNKRELEYQLRYAEAVQAQGVVEYPLFWKLRLWIASRLLGAKVHESHSRVASEEYLAALREMGESK